MAVAGINANGERRIRLVAPYIKARSFYGIFPFGSAYRGNISIAAADINGGGGDKLVVAGNPNGPTSILILRIGSVPAHKSARVVSTRIGKIFQPYGSHYTDSVHLSSIHAFK